MPIRSHRPALVKAKNMVNLAVVENAPPEAIAARNSFAKFRRYVCKHRSYEHHEVWDNALNTGEDSKCLKGIAGDDTLILSPRGSTKSTYLVEWTAYQIGKQTAPDVRIPIKILYVSYTIDVAMLKSVQIKQIVESPEFQKVFPWVRKGEKWSDRLWVIDRKLAGLPTIDEPYTLSCSGLKGATTSRRSMLIVLDDLIKSPKQIESLAIREEMATNWTNVIRPTRFEGGRAVCLGTRMRPDDIYQTDFVPQKNWQQLIQSSIIENPNGSECSYWEEGQSLQYLQETRELDPIAFSYQYQNKIVRISEQSIDPTWIINDEIPPIQDMGTLVMGVDLSASEKEKADYTVMILGGRIKNRFYILDMRRMRSVGNIEKLDSIIEMWHDWDQPRINICVEKVAYQGSIEGDFVSHVINTRGIHDLTMTPIVPKGDKLTRLRGVTGLFQNRCVVFNQYAVLGRLRDELINFGSMDRDDCADALVYCLQGLRERRMLEII